MAMDPPLPPPPPYLDVLTIHSRRLLPKTPAETAAKERRAQGGGAVHSNPPTSSDDLAALAASVRLLLEPVHLPDLSRTGLTTDKQPRDDDVLLFYPTGAKSANMRELVRETLDKHQLLRSTASSADLHAAEPPSSPSLAASASTPAITTPSAAKTPAKRKKNKSAAVTRSPVKAAMSPSGRLNPELTRQAKDVLAALRANTSKINELIAK